MDIGAEVMSPGSGSLNCDPVLSSVDTDLHHSLLQAKMKSEGLSDVIV